MNPVSEYSENAKRNYNIHNRRIPDIPHNPRQHNVERPACRILCCRRSLRLDGCRRQYDHHQKLGSRIKMKTGIGKRLNDDSLFGQQMHDDPYAVYAELRERDPVHWKESIGAWVVTRYKDVATVLNDHRFSSDRAASARHRFPQAEFQPLFDTLCARMSEKDEPDHKRLRALVHDAFTRSSIALWNTRVTQWVDKLLDAGAAKGRMDFISDFAVPLPVAVISEVVGIPQQDRRQIKAWCDDFAVVALNFYADISEQQLRDGARSVADFRSYLQARVDAIDGDDHQDLLTSLVHAEHEGSRLDLSELLANVILLLSAGNETTTCLLGNGLLALLNHPEQMGLLRRDPSLVPSAVEEFLRFDAPVQFLGRRAVETLTLGNATIEAGQMVLAFVGSANRDPDKFSNPDDLDITRSENRHMAFGHGPHFCAGSQLARTEAVIAFRSLLARFESIELDPRRPIKHRENFNIRCLDELWIELN